MVSGVASRRPWRGWSLLAVTTHRSLTQRSPHKRRAAGAAGTLHHSPLTAHHSPGIDRAARLDARSFPLLNNMRSFRRNAHAHMGKNVHSSAGSQGRGSASTSWRKIGRAPFSPCLEFTICENGMLTPELRNELSPIVVQAAISGAGAVDPSAAG